MLVTEQVDAMRAMGTDPHAQAGGSARSGDGAGAAAARPPWPTSWDWIAGSIVSALTINIGAVEFWNRAPLHALEFSDLMEGLAKPLFFGFFLATIGCYKGLTVRGGTEGVGRATTQAVVVSSVIILVSDFFLTKVALYLAGAHF